MMLSVTRNRKKKKKKNEIGLNKPQSPAVRWLQVRLEQDSPMPPGLAFFVSPFDFQVVGFILMLPFCMDTI